MPLFMGTTHPSPATGGCHLPSQGKAFAVAFLYRYNRKHIDIYKFLGNEKTAVNAFPCDAASGGKVARPKGVTDE